MATPPPAAAPKCEAEAERERVPESCPSLYPSACTPVSRFGWLAPTLHKLSRTDVDGYPANHPSMLESVRSHCTRSNGEFVVRSSLGVREGFLDFQGLGELPISDTVVEVGV